MVQFVPNDEAEYRRGAHLVREFVERLSGLFEQRWLLHADFTAQATGLSGGSFQSNSFARSVELNRLSIGDREKADAVPAGTNHARRDADDRVVVLAEPDSLSETKAERFIGNHLKMVLRQWLASDQWVTFPGGCS